MAAIFLRWCLHRCPSALFRYKKVRARRLTPGLTDARGIWTAVQQPEARFVAVKSETQQSILALHRMRAQLMKFRIMQTNVLRGILYEFGDILPEGYQPFLATTNGDMGAAARRRSTSIVRRSPGRT